MESNSKKGFDLSALDTRAGADQGFELQINDLHGNATGVFITVIGADSDDYQEAANKIANRRTQEWAKRRKFTGTVEQANEEALGLLALATRSWRTGEVPMVNLKGEELKCDRDNAMKVYRALPHVSEQVREAINDRENFIPKSAGN